MIFSVKATGGYPAKVPALKGKTFKFTEGLNVLFGENASGKSTLLRLAAIYTGVRVRDGGGWSQFVDPFHCRRSLTSSERIPFPERFLGRADMKGKVDWDGMAAFLYDPSMSDEMPRSFEISDGLIDGDDEFGEALIRVMGERTASAGQKRIRRVGMALKNMATPPDLTLVPEQALRNENEVWVSARTEYAEYVKTLPRTGPATLLLDEPDRSLSIPNQVVLWDVLPKAVAKHKCQVIVATHSIFALAADANVIALEDKYLADCKDALKALAAKVK